MPGIDPATSWLVVRHADRSANEVVQWLLIETKSDKFPRMKMITTYIKIDVLFPLNIESIMECKIIHCDIET